jgi:hypothetical protein
MSTWMILRVLALLIRCKSGQHIQAATQALSREQASAPRETRKGRRASK